MCDYAVTHFTSANTFSVLFQTLSPKNINSDDTACSNSEEIRQNIDGNMKGGNQDSDGSSEEELQVPDISSQSKEKPKKKRVPRRVVHFSDGVIEEFSTDSEEEEAKRKAEEEGRFIYSWWGLVIGYFHDVLPFYECYDFK